MTQKEEIEKEIGKQSALEAVKLSEGGELILKSLRKDVMAAIDEISTKYKTVSHAELIASSAKLAERLALLRVIDGSSNRKKMVLADLKALIESGELEE